MGHAWAVLGQYATDSLVTTGHHSLITTSQRNASQLFMKSYNLTFYSFLSFYYVTERSMRKLKKR